jgi:hypothetical protein
VQAYWRSPPYNTTRLILAVISGLIIGSFYWSLGNNYGSLPDVQNVVGASASLPFVYDILYSKSCLERRPHRLHHMRGRVHTRPFCAAIVCLVANPVAKICSEAYRSFAADACSPRRSPHKRAVLTADLGVQSSSASRLLGLSTSRWSFPPSSWSARRCIVSARRACTPSCPGCSRWRTSSCPGSPSRCANVAAPAIYCLLMFASTVGCSRPTPRPRLHIASPQTQFVRLGLQAVSCDADCHLKSSKNTDKLL